MENPIEAATKTPAVLVSDENKGFGGAERHVLTLAHALEKEGILSAVLARPTSWLAANTGSLPLHPVGFRNEVDMLSVFNIYRKLKSSDTNVLHCIGHRDLVACALARQLPGAPPTVLLKAEHSYPDDNLSPLFRWAYTQCDAITSVSRALDKAVKQAVNPGPQVVRVVIANGIEVTRPLSRRPKAGGRALRIGVLSPLRAGKGQADFIQAVASISNDRPLTVLVAGDGGERESLQSLARTHRVEVDFLGHVEEPLEFLESLDLSVVPSHKETFSLVTLESMVCGRPLIAADSEGVKELCDQDDYPVALYPVGDIQALSRALQQFCQEPESTLEKAFAAAQPVRERFSSRQMALSYRNLYQALLDAGQNAASGKGERSR